MKTSHSKGLWATGDGTGKHVSDVAHETDLLRQAVSHIKKLYPSIIIWKLHGGGYQASGIPDLYIAYKGRSIWVEFKNAKSDTSAIQKYTLELLIAQNIYCGVARNKEDLAEIVKQVISDA